MSCDECQEQLVTYVEELLDAATAEPIHSHLAECAACRAEEEATRRLQDRLASAGAGTTLVSLEEGIMRTIQRRQAVVSQGVFDARPSRRASRRTARSFAMAACLVFGIGAALAAWWNRPDRRSGEDRSVTSLAVEDRAIETRGGSRFEAALEALIAAAGDDEVLNQGLQACWSEYADDIGDGSRL